MKGGHLEGDTVVDVLRTADGAEHRFEGPRIVSRSTHGTGCTLASGIAAGIAEGLTLQGAVARARDYVVKAIELAPGWGGARSAGIRASAAGPDGAGGAGASGAARAGADALAGLCCASWFGSGEVAFGSTRRGAARRFAAGARARPTACTTNHDALARQPKAGSSGGGSGGRSGFGTGGFGNTGNQAQGGRHNPDVEAAG